MPKLLLSLLKELDNYGAFQPGAMSDDVGMAHLHKEKYLFNFAHKLPANMNSIGLTHGWTQAAYASKLGWYAEV